MDTSLIIFDFDGTLADTSAAILATFEDAIKDLNLPMRSSEECRATIGLPLKEGFRQLFPWLSEAELDHSVATYRRLFNEIKHRFPPTLFPGVAETLQVLSSRGIEMAVASSRSRASLVDYCDYCGLSKFFSLIIGADDVEHAKPHPEPVQTIMQRLGHSPESTIVVGDMPVDIAMGNSAGCDTVAVTYGNSSPQALASATHIISTFPALLKVI